MVNLVKKLENFASEMKISVTALEKSIGASKGVLGRAFTQNSDIQAKWIAAFVETYPEVSTDWLLRDDGPMLRGGDVVVGDKNINSGTNYGHIGTTHGAEDLPFSASPGRSSDCDPASCAWIKAKDEVISAKDDIIKTKDDVIEAQRITIEALRSTKA